jgi:hypothetical protein
MRETARGDSVSQMYRGWKKRKSSNRDWISSNPRRIPFSLAPFVARVYTRSLSSDLGVPCVKSCAGLCVQVSVPLALPIMFFTEAKCDKRTRNGFELVFEEKKKFGACVLAPPTLFDASPKSSPPT